MLRNRRTQMVKKPPSPLLGILRVSRHVLTAILLLSIAGYAIGRLKVKELPSETALVDALYTEPVQSPTSAEAFTFPYKNADYVVNPKATYEINGLVVSHNNIRAWWDIYHDENSVDVKDLCLIWGDNAYEHIYKNISFWNESVSCHFQPTSRNTRQDFHGSALSNNHLLSADAQVRDTIAEVRVGDQVHMKGYLVNYSDLRHPEFERRSSLTRADTGGGACEVFYVGEMQILKKSPRLWHIIYELSRGWFLTLLGIKFLSFLVFSWLEFRLS